MSSRDPIQRAADGARDLYDVAGWEQRTRLDWLAVTVHRSLLASARLVIILLAIAIVASQFLLSGFASIEEPAVGLYILLSVVPALALAGYIYHADVTSSEPLSALVVTFLLGFLLAGFAAVLNSFFGRFFASNLLATTLFFFFIVGPVEETVKWLAVRLYAFRQDSFDAVIDGAVYGAMAGLGFATIENGLYIGGQYLEATSAASSGSVLEETFQLAAVRTLAGPGHVIYSAFAGYYLGLAKFNREHRGPIIVKGLLIAVFIHALYNTLVSNLVSIADAVPPLAGVSAGLLFLAFVLVYDGIFGYALYRKIEAYRSTYHDVDAATVEADGDTQASEASRAEYRRNV